MADDYKAMKQEHNLFGWTKPVGYNMQEVDETIAEYKKTISDVYEWLADKDQHIKELEQRNDKLVKEMTQTRMQMEAFVVPEYSEEQSLEILENFQNQPPGTQEQNPPIQTPPAPAPQQSAPAQEAPKPKEPPKPRKGVIPKIIT